MGKKQDCILQGPWTREEVEKHIGEPFQLNTLYREIKVGEKVEDVDSLLKDLLERMCQENQDITDIDDVTPEKLMSMSDGTRTDYFYLDGFRQRHFTIMSPDDSTRYDVVQIWGTGQPVRYFVLDTPISQ